MPEFPAAGNDATAAVVDPFTAPVCPLTLVTGAPGIQAAIFEHEIVGDPVVESHAAVKSIASPIVVLIVQVLEVCKGTISPAVRVVPDPTN